MNSVVSVNVGLPKDVEWRGTLVSVVLVHGAWADGSSWSDIIKPLQSRGLKAMAAPIPLTSLSDDVAALERALERTDGPVVLVAHAYAGAVIGASVNERVRSLVFIAALAPDEGETVGEIFYREKPHPEAPQLAPDRHGFIWMPDDRFGAAFCQHASAEQAALLAATQRPIALARKGAEAGVEDEVLLVSRGAGGSDDQPGDTAVPGTTDGRADPIGKDRPRTAGDRTRIGRRNDP